jgi:hypothetical protein
MTKKEKSWFIRHWFLTGLMILVILMIIGGMSSSDNLPVDGDDLPTVDSIKTYGLNEEIIIKDFKYTFLSAKTQNSVGSEFFGEDASGIFLIIDLEVENVGNEAEYIPNEIYIIDNQEREFSQDDSVWIYLDDNFIFEELNPGLTKKGQLIFDIPEGIVGKICIKGNMFSSKCDAYVNWK